MGFRLGFVNLLQESLLFEFVGMFHLLDVFCVFIVVLSHLDVSTTPIGSYRGLVKRFISYKVRSIDSASPFFNTNVYV